MGWFDGDSSEDDGDDDKKKDGQTLAVPLMPADGEEEDPLDAYMKSLSNTTTTTTSTSNNKHENNPSKSSARRMDLENEEEATSHWETSKTQSNHAAKEKEIQERYEQQQRAKDLVFHRATTSDDHHDGSFHPTNDLSHSQAAVTVSAAAAAAATANLPEAWKKPFQKDFLSMEQKANSDEGKKWRKDNEVRISGLTSSLNSAQAAAVPDPVYHLEELREVFGANLLAKIQELGFRKPTTVQSQALPLAMSGHDLCVTAATGQGKTLSFVWPIAVHIAARLAAAKPRDEEAFVTMGPIALVLVPTRELATQVHRQVAKPLLAAISANSRAVIGGQGKYILQQELKQKGGVDFVVATPGRLVDVAADYRQNGRKGLSLSRVTMLVLDEADKMLAMGFEKQVRHILQQLRPDRQTLLFSATMSRRIERVAQEWLSASALRLSVGRTGQASMHVKQHVMVLPSPQAKTEFLLEMLPELAQVGRALVFVATRDGCESLAAAVRQRHGSSLGIETLHGDKHQSGRNAALRAFASGDTPVLIATDVAARGLDVADIATVLNYDPAKTLDAHVHRIGRAGRLSKDHQGVGSAYTLLTSKNADFAHVLMNALERDGGEVSSELRSLAQRSRKSGNVASRNQNNKSGLGFDPRDVSFGQGRHREPPLSPSGERSPKRSRWSS